MFRKVCLGLTVFFLISLFISSPISAAPSASILYAEADLGGGLWQYDYTFRNNSSNNEYLYSVYLNFSQEVTVDWVDIPTGWDNNLWGHTPESTIFLDSFSTSANNDITAGTSLGVFSFTVDSQVGNLSYNAYFDDHLGGFTSTTGSSTVVPEPVSLVLFLSGGALLGIRKYFTGKI